MALTGIQLRSSKYSTFPYTAPSGGVVGGAMGKIGDAVVVFYKTKAAGAEVAAVYDAEKIVLTKKTGSGEAIAKGAKIYYEAASGKVTGVAGSNVLCGRALEAVGVDATTVLARFNGACAA